MITLSRLAKFYLLAGLSSPVMAQSLGTIPPGYLSVDENGVDPVRGSYNFSLVEGSIGEGGEALRMVRYWGESGWSDNWAGTLYKVAESGKTNIYIVFGGTSEKFTQNGSLFVNSKGNGATLTGDLISGVFTYTGSDGTTVTYTRPYGQESVSVTIYQDGGCKTGTGGTNMCALPTRFVKPNGYTIN